MTELSKFQKLRIAVEVMNDLKEVVENNNTNFIVYSNDYEDTINEWIAKKAGISIIYGGFERGYINIEEYISMSRDEKEEKTKRNIDGKKPYKPKYKSMDDSFGVSEELKLKTKEFEEKNIPSSGPCKTTIGEIFRAIQRIQYRAFNDGDLWFIIGTPNFMSNMYLVSMIDEINWSNDSYDKETGEHHFEFTDEGVKKHSWDGKISNIIESPVAEDGILIKYQLMDLLLNGKIKDTPNEYDSRGYTSLKNDNGGRYY